MTKACERWRSVWGEMSPPKTFLLFRGFACREVTRVAGQRKCSQDHASCTGSWKDKSKGERNKKEVSSRGKKKESVWDTENWETRMPLGKFHFWRNRPSHVGDLGDTRQSHWWGWDKELKARALNGRAYRERQISKPCPMLRMPASPHALPPEAEVYSGPIVLGGDLAKMPILMQWVWGGAWDAAFLIGPGMMLILLIHRQRCDQHGLGEHECPEGTWKQSIGVREDNVRTCLL